MSHGDDETLVAAAGQAEARISVTAATSPAMSSSLATSGGAKRTVEPWVSLARMPRAISASDIWRPDIRVGSMSMPAQAPRIPTGRKGEPAELAASVVFLASDAAGYITGQTLAVDGGITIT